MPSRRITSSLLAALALLAAHTSAYAGLILHTPRTSFAERPVEISFGTGEARYRFGAAAEAGLVAAATGGTALLASYGPPFFDPARPAVYLGPGLIADDPVATWLAYPNATTIPFSNARVFLGLQFVLQDGIHFGYAEIGNLALLSYAFETRVGQKIIIGADPPAVIPEPASLALLMSGVAIVVALRRRLSLGFTHRDIASARAAQTPQHATKGIYIA